MRLFGDLHNVGTVQRRVIYDLLRLQPLTLGLAMLRHVRKFFSTVGGDFLCAHRSIIAETAAD